MNIDMIKFKQFATSHPVIFGLIIIFIAVFVEIVGGTLAFVVGDTYGSHIVRGLILLAGTLFLLLIPWRFNWLRTAGIARLGRIQQWLFVLPAIIYLLITNMYAIFGDFGFQIQDQTLAGVIAFENLIDGGLWQEITFRGVILYGLIRAWGNSKQGIFKSVIVSALMFGVLHSLNLINIAFDGGKPVSMTLFQILDTFLSGIYYGFFVLLTGSIWPMVILHGLQNALVNVKAVFIPSFAETTSMWVQIILFDLPMVIYGLYLFRKITPRSISPDAI